MFWRTHVARASSSAFCRSDAGERVASSSGYAYRTDRSAGDRLPYGSSTPAASSKKSASSTHVMPFPLFSFGHVSAPQKRSSR